MKTEATVTDPLLTKKDLAIYLKVVPRTIDRYVQFGLPRLVMPGGSVRFRRSDVLEWLEEYNR